jgi:hypothetical protein
MLVPSVRLIDDKFMIRILFLVGVSDLACFDGDPLQSWSAGILYSGGW